MVAWWEARPYIVHRQRPWDFEMEWGAPVPLGPIKEQWGRRSSGYAWTLISCVCEWARFPSAFLDRSLGSVPSVHQPWGRKCFSGLLAAVLYKCTLHSSDYFSSNTVFARLLLLNVILPLFLVDVAVIYQLLTSLVICGYLPSYLYLIRQHSILWKIPHSMVSHGKVISNIHLPLQTPPMETHRASVWHLPLGPGSWATVTKA